VPRTSTCRSRTSSTCSRRSASSVPRRSPDSAGALLYPLGFVCTIIGGYQLYTENTLPPVALTLQRLAPIPTLLRHWLIVLAGNFVGDGLGALALGYGGVFDDATAEVAIGLATKGIATPSLNLFFKTAFAGFIVADPAADRRRT
jgi:formate/nitrite transporter FocA (FNT family)